MKIFLILLHLIFLQNYILAQDSTKWVESEHEIPLDLGTGQIYMEKFSPIYIQDISDSDFDRISSFHKSKSNLSDFVEFLDIYNQVFYRKINSYIDQTKEQYDWSARISPMYLRDFNESNDENYRFIIVSEHSLVDIFLSSKYGEPMQKAFNFRLVDKKNGIKYSPVNNIDLLFAKLDYYYESSTGKSPKIMSQELFDQQLSRVKYKPRIDMKERIRTIASQSVTAVLYLSVIIIPLVWL